MQRKTIVAFIADQANVAPLEMAADAARFALEIHEGDIDAACEVARTWTIVPDLLVIDVSREESPEEALARFAAAAPAGETHLLVIGRDNEIGSYRRFKKLGVFEYLVSPIDAEDLAHSLEDYKREAIARGDAIDPSKVLVVTGARGGLGTSTIAAALAQGIASKHDKRVLLLDLDLETGCQYVINNTEPTEGFGLMLEQPRNVDSLLLNRTLAKPMHNLFLLSDAAPEIYGRIAPDAATLLIAQSYRDMDVVVVDLPVRSIFAAQMLANAGTIVMVTAPTLYGLRDAMALADQAEKGQVETPLLAINRVGEVRNGAVPLSTFRQKLAKGARPDFRNALDGGIFEIPYAAKTAQLFAHRNETLLNDTGALGRSLQALLSRLPTAPQHSRRERSFMRMLLGS